MQAATAVFLLALAYVAFGLSSQSEIDGVLNQTARMNNHYPFQPSFQSRFAKLDLIRDVKPDFYHLREPMTSFYGLVGIGTPAKTFRMTFDTASSEIWVPYYTWNPLATNLHYSRGYDCKDSRTSNCTYIRKLRINFRDSINLDVYTYDDVFTLYGDTHGYDASDPNSMRGTGGSSFRQIFAAADNSDSDIYRYRTEDGYIGLAPVAQSSSGIPFLLISMQTEQKRAAREESMRQNEIPGTSDEAEFLNTDANENLGFGFWFNPNLSSRLGGELTLGGADPRRFYGQFQFHSINSWFYWQLKLNDVMFNNRLISCPSGCNAILDTGANSIVGPHQDVEVIYEELGAKYDRESELHLVECETVQNLPSMKFTFDHIPYTILPNHYIRMTTFNRRNYCYVGIKAWNKVDWLLGTSFIGAYYIYFDFSNRAVGFAASQHS